MTSPLPLTLAAESSAPRSFRANLDRVLLYGVVGLLLFGPLAFGAVERWSMSIMQVGAGLLFALWAARQVAVGELEIVGNPLFFPMLFFAGLILWQLATRTNGLSCRHLFNRTALPCLRTVVFPGGSVPAQNITGEGSRVGFLGIWLLRCSLRVDAGHRPERQAVLASISAIWRLDIWSVT